MKKKKQSKFAIITKVVIWLMLIATLVGVGAGAVASFL